MNVKSSDPTSMRPDDSVILAAGGLLWREGTEGQELLLVFRRRYEDWTLPKGKVKAEDENFIATARREVREETGYEVRIDGFAGCICYAHDGHPKVVMFWNMAPVGEPVFKPSEEVERCEWFSLREALCRLSHENEKDLLLRSAGESVKTREGRR